jgi:aminoglycoside/choline kinase family phosphotransferase
MIPPSRAPAFLAANGWEGAAIVPLAGDASFRRYFRVLSDDRSAVLMDAPPPHEDPRPFVAVAEWLARAGLTAPEILAADLDSGLLLIGDLGNARLRETLDDEPAMEKELYGLAVDLLVQLHARPPMAGLRRHGLEQWLEELELFCDWYCPAVGVEVDVGGYRRAWRAVLEDVATDGLGAVTVLRDFHAENIMLLRDREGISQLGLLDFQDAVEGHPAYDLVSVLEDARRDVPASIETQMLERYMSAASPGPVFERAYWSLAAQRNTRILGVFTRLWKRDHKPHYRTFQPRMWGLLERDLARPWLAPVREWFDTNVPPEKRASAWTAGAGE